MPHTGTPQSWHNAIEKVPQTPQGAVAVMPSLISW
jgi:hypothetical protein